MTVYHARKILNQKYLRAVFAMAAALGLCLAPVAAKTRVGEKLLKQGQAAEAKGDWDTALRFYQQAVDETPTDPGYLIPMRRARFAAGQKHVEQGQKLRADGKL